jgi:hypothetical protein
MMINIKTYLMSSLIKGAHCSTQVSLPNLNLNTGKDNIIYLDNWRHKSKSLKTL